VAGAGSETLSRRRNAGRAFPRGMAVSCGPQRNSAMSREVFPALRGRQLVLWPCSSHEKQLTNDLRRQGSSAGTGTPNGIMQTIAKRLSARRTSAMVASIWQSGISLRWARNRAIIVIRGRPLALGGCAQQTIVRTMAARDLARLRHGVGRLRADHGARRPQRGANARGRRDWTLRPKKGSHDPTKTGVRDSTTETV